MPHERRERAEHEHGQLGARAHALVRRLDEQLLRVARLSRIRRRRSPVEDWRRLESDPTRPRYFVTEPRMGYRLGRRWLLQANGLKSNPYKDSTRCAPFVAHTDLTLV